MIFTGLDIETTGRLDPNHKIIELCLQKWDVPDLTKPVPALIGTKVWRFNPGRSIEPKAYEVHKISLDDLSGCPTFAEAHREVLSFAEGTDYFVAQNGDDFDRPFMRMELEMASADLSDYEKVPWFDTARQGRWAAPWGKLPNLGELCWATDVEYVADEAHAAEYDVTCMMKAFFFGLRTGFFTIT